LIYVGCDLGIVSAKAVIIENSDILAFEIVAYRNHPKQAAVEVVDKALARAGLSKEEIDYCLSTGFGGKAVAHADGVIPHRLCLYRAVRELNPKIRTVIDVGGHSFTAFNIDGSGKISETAITDVCVAGTGIFIEVMAKALEMPLDELIWTSLGSKDSLPITSTCAVFAESEVVSLVNDGYDRSDIFAGIASSVAAKIASIVRRISVDEEVAMTGGMAKNSIVVRDFERRLGIKLADLAGVDPQVVGAFGAALMAKEGLLHNEMVQSLL
jgi:predicted CoA-substrate-specific enzyme activase